MTIFRMSPKYGDLGGHYVAKNGNNGWAGTYAAPWLTINYACTQLVPGDTLYIRGGSYHELVVAGIDGTAIAPIIIRNYPGESVFINGEYTLPVNYYDILVNIWANYTILMGVAIINSGGVALLIHGISSHAINVTGNGSKETGMVANGSNNLIDGCTMMDNGNGYGIGGQTTWGSAICTTGSNTIIQNCLSYENRGEGINAYNTAVNTIIQNNIIYNNRAVNLYLDSVTGAIVQRNLIYQTVDAYERNGITIANEWGLDPSDLIIRNNFIKGCYVNLEVDSNVVTLDNVHIINNTFVNASGNYGIGYDMNVYFRATIVNYITSVFKNNIVLEENANRRPIDVETSHSGLTFSYNCWSKTPDADAAGTGDITDDPELAKSGSVLPGELTGDYFKLLATSPARGIGLADAEVTEDYWETARSDPPDMGGHEYT